MFHSNRQVKRIIQLDTKIFIAITLEFVFEDVNPSMLSLVK